MPVVRPGPVIGDDGGRVVAGGRQFGGGEMTGKRESPLRMPAVWLVDNGYGYAVGYTGTDFFREATRYLRADLTCGECSKVGTISCEMSMAHPAITMVLRPVGFFPACMEFVPKETE